MAWEDIVVVCLTPRRSRIGALVHCRICYKIATLTYKVLAYNQLLYLSHLLTPHTAAYINPLFTR